MKEYVEFQLQCKMYNLQINNGHEYVFKAFNELCVQHGIHRQLMVSHMAQNNGIVEFFNPTLMKAIWFMLFQAQLPKSYWGEDLVIANYVQNCLSKKTLQQHTFLHMKYGATCTISWDIMIHLKHTSLKVDLIDGSLS
jgi:hypothetical protein